MMTDPIADLLTRIRNGCHARQDRADIPWSRVKEAICRVLVAEGYLEDVNVAGEGIDKRITVFLHYGDRGTPVIQGIRRLSRPGLRRYTGAGDIPSVRNGLGVCVVSTPEGLLADREARRRNVGGEILCEVW